MPRERVRLPAALFVILVSGQALAQRLFDFNVLKLEPPVHNIPYDGRFTFARLRYTSGPGGYYYRGLPAWAHGYASAEWNLMSILNEITTLAPHVEKSNVFALDDPELCRFPVAYMTEVGFWTMTDAEAAGFREFGLTH